MLPQSETGAGGGETLYIEIRHGRGPVDPEPWFAERERIGRRPMRKIWMAGIGGAVAGVVVSTQFAAPIVAQEAEDGEVGLRAARPLRRHLRADPHLLRRGGRREGADRERDQRHADAPRPAFELPAARRLRRHAGADQGRVRRARHRGHPGERLRQGGGADRGHARRPGRRPAGRPHHPGRRRERARADAQRGGRPDARAGRLGHHHHPDPRGRPRSRSTSRSPARRSPSRRCARGSRTAWWCCGSPPSTSRPIPSSRSS